MIPKPLQLNLQEQMFNRNYKESVELTESIQGEEEYRLNIEEGFVKISARTEKGAFYAKQTVAQLRLDNDGKLPCCTVSDKPAYSYRSLMFDPSRHFLSLERLYRIVDAMAFYKLNRLHIHLTDDQGWRVEIKKYPLLTEKGSIRGGTQSKCDGSIESGTYGKGMFYTQAELKALVAYAQERFIEVIPEIDMPGHLLAAISVYPELACGNPTVKVRESWGVEDVIACAGKPEIYNFVRDVIEELAEIFPGEYFHIGGDEVPKTKWKTCPECQRVIKENGLKDENALQGYFNLKVTEILAEYGKKPMLWYENLGIDFPKGAMMQIWRAELDAKAADCARNSDGVIISHGSYFYFDYPYLTTSLKQTYGFDAKRIGLPEDVLPNVRGVEGTLWSEWIRDDDKLSFNLYPRMQAIAEVAWSTDRGNYKDFLNRLKPHLARLDSEGVYYCPVKLADLGFIKRGLLHKKFYSGKSDWTAELEYCRKNRDKLIK